MSKKILVVDNNREYRHTIASMVRRVGYDVIHAEEIVEARERLVSDRPDLVMMGDGVEVADWLKANQFPVSIPVIVYTGQQAVTWVNEILSNGAAAILAKPISFADLRDVLRKYLNTSKNRPRPLPSPSFVKNSTP